MNKRLVALIPVILAASLFLVSPSIPRAHALTGTVCVVFPSTSTTCSAGSPTIGPETSGSSFTVGVFVSGSDPMGGFDIYVKSDPSVVNPTSAALGTLIVNPSLTSICVNGSATTGSCTANSANGPGVVEVTTIESTGSNECASIGPCSGLAFTITYTVAGTAATTQLTYPTNAACANSSISLPANVCVLVSDAFGNTLSETVQTPAATITQNVASLVSVVTDSTGALYSSTFSGTAWGAWQSVSGKTSFSPGLCSSGPGKAELVVVATDGQLKHNSFSGGTFAATWDAAGGSLTGQPTCAVLNGVLYVVARAPDTPNSLYSNSKSLPAGSWTGWVYLAGASRSTPSLVATPSMNRLDLVVRGDDNRIYHKSFTPTTSWAATWDTPLGGSLAAPAAVSDGTLLHVVVQGQDNGVWYNSLTLSSNTWGTWTYLNSGTTSAPAVALDSGGVLHIVVRGQNDGIYHDTKPTTGPPGTTWTSASGGLTSDSPAANAVGNNVAILVRGSDNGLYFNVLTGTAFGTWASANGASPNAPVVANL